MAPMMGPRAIVLGIVLASAPSALAQPKTQPTPKEQAAELVKKAIAKSDAGDHQAAIALYLEAYKLAPLHTLLSNVGTEYQKDGKPYDALRYFCMYLEKDPTGVNVTYATAKAKAINIEIGNKDVTDADVCKPKPKPPDKPAGGGTTGTTSGTTTGTSGGTVVTETPPKKPDPGRGMKLGGIAIAGGGAVMVGLGVLFGIKAQNATDIVNNHKMGDPWPNNIRQIEADGQRDENLQIGLLAAGGAAIVGGAALYFIGNSKKSTTERNVAVVPAATAHSVGVSISGGF